AVPSPRAKAAGVLEAADWELVFGDNLSLLRSDKLYPAASCIASRSEMTVLSRLTPMTVDVPPATIRPTPIAVPVDECSPRPRNVTYTPPTTTKSPPHVNKLVLKSRSAWRRVRSGRPTAS